MKKAMLSVELRKEIETALKKCYACSRCVSGCPVASDMDYPPSVLIRWFALGDFERLLKSRTIWICASCHMCYSRCPFEINIPHVMDMLKEYAYKHKINRKERAIQLFHRFFLASIKRFGRIHEASFMGEWKLYSGKWFSDILLGMHMFFKGKLRIFPEKIKQQKEIKRLFEQTIHKE